MSQFHKKPYQLTKEQLKKDLRANGISLPKAEQRKDFYVKLYEESFLSSVEDDEALVDEYSSDDEETPGSTPIRATKKLPAKRKKIVLSQRVKDLPFDVAALSDGDLVRQLKHFGGPVGPITDSTRPLYQKKLEKLLSEESKNPVSSAKIDTVQKKASPPRVKKEKISADFSDTNDESADELKVETVTNSTFNEDEQDQPDARPQKAASLSQIPTPSQYSLRKRPVSDTAAAKQSTSQPNLVRDPPGDTGNNVKQTENVANNKKKSSQEDKEEKSLLIPGGKLGVAIMCFVVFAAFLMYILMEDPPNQEITTSR